MWEKEHHISDGINASPSRPSAKSRMKMKIMSKPLER